MNTVVHLLSIIFFVEMILIAVNNHAAVELLGLYTPEEPLLVVLKTTSIL
jgi:hypothetical protein